MKPYALASAFAYLLLAPFAGGLLAGIDRKLTARFQGRVGPPLLQPFHDLRKLLSRRIPPVNRLQFPLLACHLVFAAAAGFLLFLGIDLLLMVFVLTLAAVFLVLAAYSTGSPYAKIGADRELVVMMAYEPMVILAVVGLFRLSGERDWWGIAASGKPLALLLPGVLAGFVFILLMKLRKSPFDLATSHHAHQELVKGLTADMGGPALALIELAHWYESVWLYAFVFLFFAWNPVAAAAGPLLAYFVILLTDNSTARVRWEAALASGWIVALVAGAGNLVPFFLGGRP